MHRTRKALAVVSVDASLCHPVQNFTGLIRSQSNWCRFIHAVFGSLGPNLGPKLSLMDWACGVKLVGPRGNSFGP
jgi:hypothetical protein